MKIKITTDRGPWLDNAPQPNGAVIDADAHIANALIERGWAEKADERQKKGAANG